jgi:hypothetical protein
VVIDHGRNENAEPTIAGGYDVSADCKVGLGLQQQTQALSHHGVVIGDGDRQVGHLTGATSC